MSSPYGSPSRAADADALASTSASLRANLARLDRAREAADDEFRRALHHYGQVLVGHETGSLKGPAHDQVERTAERLVGVETERQRVAEQLDDLLVEAVARFNPSAVILPIRGGYYGGDPDIFARPVKTTAEAIAAVQRWLATPARQAKLAQYRTQANGSRP